MLFFFRKDNFFNCNDCKEFIGIQASFKTQIILAEVLVLFALQKTKLRIPERSELTGVLFALQKTKLRIPERSELTGVLFALQKTKLRIPERSELTGVLFALQKTKLR